MALAERGLAEALFAELNWQLDDMARSTDSSSSARPIPRRCQLRISISGLVGRRIVYVAVEFRGLDEG